MRTRQEQSRDIVVSRYEITGTLHESRCTRICRALSLPKREPVILKLLKPDTASKEDLARFRRELRILRKVNISGFPNLLGFQESRDGPVMMFADIGGVSLDHLAPEVRLSLREFLDLGIGLSGTLAELHRRRITHKAICPAHIVLNRQTGQFHLVGFGSADELPQLAVAPQACVLLEHDLAYISPEQTGRMNRAVDYRTDFYSLGATFYQLLTGKFPFVAEDALGLVHSHIAANSTPPCEVDPSVPETLSRIVLKLMAKMAEDRYQSANGLRADLERCRQELSERGNISEFELGQQDFTDQLRVPQKLYGREREIMQLLEAFDRVRAGGRELLLVAGYSGVGKTALVQEVQRPVLEANGYFLEAKFDQLQRNVPYYAWIQALRGLVNALLMESEAQLARLKESILRALGNIGRVLTDVIPNLELIIGPQPEVPALGGTEARNRLRYVFMEFIRAVAVDEHPLVVFLDDLQWIDVASLGVLESLLSSSLISHLLVIGAYRDNEVDALHPLTLSIEQLRKEKVRINRLSLEDLSQSTVDELLADVLHAPRKRTILLTRLLYAKTGGNPFFLLQTLRALAEQNAIAFDIEQRSWQWDITALRSRQITDNVLTLMLEKIRQLPKDTQQILTLAACLGFSFRMADLAVSGKQSEGQALEFLYPALREGVLTLAGNDYQFAHDRIQQAAYELIPETARKHVHLELGRMLRQHLADDDSSNQLFTVVDHLNIGSELLPLLPERLDVARLNLRAGRKAKASTAFAPAHKYFEAGLRLLDEEHWTTHYDVSLELHSLAAETATLVGDFERTDQLFESVIGHARNALDMAVAYLAKMSARKQGRSQEEALACALEILERLEVHLEPHPTAEDDRRALADLMSCYDPHAIRALADLPEMTNPQTRAAMRILEAATDPAFVARPYLHALIVSEQVKLSIRHGTAPESMLAYCSLAFRLCALPGGDIDKGFEFAKLAMALAETSTAVALVPKLKATIVGMVWEHKQHVRETLDQLLPLYSSCKQVGDFGHAIHVMCYYARLAYLAGNPLAELDRELAGYAEDVKSLRAGSPSPYILVYRQAAQNLLGQSECPWVLDGAAYDCEAMLRIILDQGLSPAQEALQVNTLVLCYLFGHYDEALAASTESERCRPGLMTDAMVWLFYDSLTRLALCPHVAEEDRARSLERVTANQSYLKMRAHYAPMNFLHKWHLVEAEKASVLGRTLEAMEHFDCAIALAGENGFIQDQALANERAMRFWLEKGKPEFAKVHLRSAREQYAHWQAWAKVSALEAEYPQWLDSKSGGDRERMRSSLDIDTVMKATHAISSEMEIDRLLSQVMHTVIENAGAQRGYLLLEEAGQWSVAAIGSIDQSEVELPHSTRAEECEGIGTGVVRFVVRTLEQVVLVDAAREGDFINDPHIRQQRTKSLLCAPLLNRGRLIGILYLENNLTTHAFTPDRVELLEMLLSQAATSIENARSYTKLKESEARYRRINRELHAISSCNQTLLHITDEQTLINEVCRIVCEKAGYLTAWVGYAQDNDVKSVCPVAWAGNEDGYFERADISWSEDTELGRGPTGTAIRSGITCYVEDYNDAKVTGWREDAAQRGYASVIALPLKDEHGRAFGTLTIYSSETHAFPAEEIRMLEELAGDLAFGITVIRARIERTRAEETLALRSFALNSVHEAALLVDEQGHIRDVNEECSRALGYSREQLLEMTVPDVDPAISAEYWPEHWAELRAHNSLTFERLLRSKDGRITPVEINANYLEYGGTAYNLALGRDITERKRAEEEKAKLQQRLTLIIEQSPLGFLGWNLDSRVTEWNPAAERIFGYTKEEVLGRDISFLVPEPFRESVNERVTEVQTEKVVKRGTNENLTKDGRTILCDWCNAPLIDSQGHVMGSIALCEDVTVRCKLEEQLRQSQKMEAIGQLAGGVAHDFNNILGIINGYSEILMTERELKETQRASIEEILAAGQRAASLTRQLLAFSRKLVLQPKVLNLNSVIEGFEKMLRRLIGDNIEVHTVLDRNLSAVNADPNQMEQILLNFCINARDAMPEGGRITIETSNLELDESMAAQNLSLSPGRYATLSVSDTGIGMDQETQSRIFEPFFTTKGPERGTGLGLATVYGIVKQSGGHVSVYSEPGQGTTFRVYLPAVSQQVSERVQISAPQELSHGAETVLLVEDAAPLRELYRKILEDRGYTVLEAGDGQRAIQIAEQYTGNIALLLTDVSLPKMNGPALAKILMQQRPTMRVLFMSGHSDEVVSGPDHLLAACTSFIQKPFGAEELFRRMRAILDAQEPEMTP